jgi:hypothetical protein
MEKQKKQFLSKVNQTETCWEWEGFCDNFGYGRIQTNWAKELSSCSCPRTHRISHLLFKGEIGDKDVLHSCDNRKCVNPDHLRLGTQVENNIDRDTRGRHITLQGEHHGSSKFTQEQVNEMINLRDTGMFYKDIAVQFNCNRRTIERILLGKTGYNNSLNNI